ncbi:MAG TPA: C45 family peptidase, partial [Planctomycetota bacterium]|nr:C45 family peptidase [Planctomycetota bacterium]
AMNKLNLVSLKGTLAQCGEDYGEQFEPLMMGFCKQELKPDRRKLAYARRCWPAIQASAPKSAQFIQGLARGAHLSLEHVILLSVHEEVYHQQHCTAFAACQAATKSGRTIIGQNWDWSPALYPWAGLVRIAARGEPAVAAYHYPGLWCSAGVNAEGLALVWTGAGYRPAVQPKVGVPTYVLIAEILRRKNVPEALAWLSRVNLAGAFIFFLGDAAGNIAVAEGMPGKLVIDQSKDVLTRGNHYACPAIIRASKQPNKDPLLSADKCERDQRMHRLLIKHRGKITLDLGKSFLLDRTGNKQWLHQYPHGPLGHELGGLTIDSILVECESRKLWTCRGGRVPGPWQCVTA